VARRRDPRKKVGNEEEKIKLAKILKRTKMASYFEGVVAKAVKRYVADPKKVEVSTSTEGPQPDVGHAFCSINHFRTVEEALTFCRERAEDDHTTLLYINLRDLGPWHPLLSGGSSQGQFSALNPVCEIKREAGEKKPQLREKVPFYIREGRGTPGRVDYEIETEFEGQDAAMKYLQEVVQARSASEEKQLQMVALYVGSPLRGEEKLRFCRGQISYIPTML
jgi:hypothetical protein